MMMVNYFTYHYLQGWWRLLSHDAPADQLSRLASVPRQTVSLPPPLPSLPTTPLILGKRSSRLLAGNSSIANAIALKQKRDMLSDLARRPRGGREGGREEGPGEAEQEGRRPGRGGPGGGGQDRDDGGGRGPGGPAHQAHPVGRQQQQHSSVILRQNIATQ